jgi:2-dehydro-3-deoxy-D-arabinonate dehydratase
MKLHRTAGGVVLETEAGFHRLDEGWDALVNRDDLARHLRALADARAPEPALPDAPLAPIGAQEVWAAGVTYYRSRTARMEESREAGGGSFYDRVYDAPRPELFFKAAPWRVRGPGDPCACGATRGGACRSRSSRSASTRGAWWWATRSATT